MKVDFRDSFVKDLKAVKERGLLGRVRSVIEAFEKANSLDELPNLKKLKGGGNYLRVRVGDYRLGIAPENDTVVFVRFLNRKDIYKHFP
ncbi:MAG TPA: type II toxin-antitoxin system RelE/ParE family toxin [Pyrinomonadaceae bacterium]|nr:type II toxin-antitoxin system RelE/ParE family toxin [Pyrinomonadaceae bacterium]